MRILLDCYGSSCSDIGILEGKFTGLLGTIADGHILLHVDGVACEAGLHIIGLVDCLHIQLSIGEVGQVFDNHVLGLDFCSRTRDGAIAQRTLALEVKLVVIAGNIAGGNIAIALHRQRIAIAGNGPCHRHVAITLHREGVVIASDITFYCHVAVTIGGHRIVAASYIAFQCHAAAGRGHRISVCQRRVPGIRLNHDTRSAEIQLIIAAGAGYCHIERIGPVVRESRDGYKRCKKGLAKCYGEVCFHILDLFDCLWLFFRRGSASKHHAPDSHVRGYQTEAYCKAFFTPKFSYLTNSTFCNQPVSQIKYRNRLIFRTL